MADKRKSVEFVVSVTSDKAVKGQKKVTDSVKGTVDEFDKLGKKTDQLGIKQIALGNTIANAFSKIAKMGIESLKEAYNTANHVQEISSKFATVLGENAERATRYIDEYASKMGLARSEAQNMVATNVAIAEGFGFTRESAYELAESVIKLSGDLQTFHEIPLADIQDALTTALTGNTRALRRMGIVLDQTDIAQQALNDTGKESINDLTQQERVTATLALITDRAGIAVGDLDRTMGSNANQARRLTAEYATMKEDMATELIPVFTEFIHLGNSVVDWTKDWLNLQTSDRLIKESAELNSLATMLGEAVRTGSDRSMLIDELNDKYPEYLRNLDTELLTTDDLASSLDRLNGYYTDKIALQMASEEQEKKMRKSANVIRNEFDFRIKAQTHINKLNEDYELGLDFSNGTLEENIELTKEAVLATKDLGYNVNTLTGFQKGLEVRVERSKKARDEATKSNQAYIKTLRELKEAGSEVVKPEKPSVMLPEIPNPQVFYEDINLEDYTLELPSLLAPPDSIAEQKQILAKLQKELNEAVTDEARKSAIDSIAEVEKVIEAFGKGMTLEEYELSLAISIDTKTLEGQRALLQNAQDELLKASSDKERSEATEKIKQIQLVTDAYARGITTQELLDEQKRESDAQAHLEKMDMLRSEIQFMQEGAQVVSGFMAVISNNRIQDIEKEKQAEMARFDAELSNNLLTQQQREAILARRSESEKQYQKEVKKEQRKQFQLEKVARLAEIAMNTAVAVSKVYGQTGIFGLAAQAPILAMGSAQALSVSMQANPYLGGGLIKERLRDGKTSRGKKLISINENDKPEFITNARSTSEMEGVLRFGNSSPSNAREIQQMFNNSVGSNNSGLAKSRGSSKMDSEALISAIRDGIGKIIINNPISVYDINESQGDYVKIKSVVGNE